MSAPTLAQSVASGSFHVYVDPIHGDDLRAAARNPVGDNSPGSQARPLQRHPFPTAVSGNLKHAPYPFRTIKKAVEYIEAWPTKDPTTGRSLPYVNTQVSPQEMVDFVVIHLMPGLYGPRRASVPAASEEYEPASGLPWNGEQYPIELPPRVSLQGGSALDTILDARGYADPAFADRSLLSLGVLVRDSTGSPRQAAADGYTMSFIDSVTIRGTSWTQSAPSPGGGWIITAGTNGENGVAVAIRGPLGIAPTISNCFIVGNQIGVGLFDPSGSADDGNHHRPRLIGNSFVWNNIGLYSRYQAGSVGTSRPILLNNLFDPVLWDQSAIQVPTWLAAVYGGPDPINSCFEGIDPSDLIAHVPGCSDATTGLPPLVRSFNAYLPQHANAGMVSKQFFTEPRSGLGPPPPPIVDLGLAGISPPNSLFALRADLYVRDAIARQGHPLVSRHDFRLAPMVRAATTATTFRNPLVNQGISLRGGPIEFHHFNLSGPPTIASISTPPGAPSDDLARFHCLDWDGEGFGNPREARRTDLFASGMHLAEPFACAGFVDLGADEVGELIVAGYLDDTRTFSRPHTTLVSGTGRAPQTLQLADASRLFFLNLTDAAGNPASYVGPQMNLRFDSRVMTPPTTVSSAPLGGVGEPIGPEWYAQLGPTHNPFVVPGVDPALPEALTSGQFQVFPLPADKAMRFELVRTGPIATHYPSFCRSRVVDLGPHVLEDIRLDPNPATRDVDYAEYDFLCPGFVVADRQHDIFGANPWFDMGDFSSNPGQNDNKFLYIDVALGRRLRHGTLNPPLTIFEDPIQVAGSGLVESFLFRNATHPLLLWGVTLFPYTVAGPNGISAGDPAWFASAFGMATDRPWYAVRVNMELFDPDNPAWSFFGEPVNNLQSFLVIDEAPAMPGSPSGGELQAPVLRATETTLAERREALRLSGERRAEGRR
ncbi:MAG: hypothetical protein IT457_18620 [Planctomycetes bacterium]|nr:hypothetical protein [Planctomycetota bacterium]